MRPWWPAWRKSMLTGEPFPDEHHHQRAVQEYRERELAVLAELVPHADFDVYEEVA